MNNIKYLILLSFSLASYSQEVTFIPKGTAAPYEGYLFTPAAELKNRTLLLDLDYEKETNKLLNSQILTYKDLNADIEKQKDLWKDSSLKLSKDYAKATNYTFFQSFLFFTLGVISTTLIVQAVK